MFAAIIGRPGDMAGGSRRTCYDHMAPSPVAVSLQPAILRPVILKRKTLAKPQFKYFSK